MLPSCSEFFKRAQSCLQNVRLLCQVDSEIFRKAIPLLQVSSFPIGPETERAFKEWKDDWVRPA